MTRYFTFLVMKTCCHFGVATSVLLLRCCWQKCEATVEHFARAHRLSLNTDYKIVVFLKIIANFWKEKILEHNWYSVSEFWGQASSDGSALTGSFRQFNNVDINETICNLINVTMIRGIKLHLINSNVLVTAFECLIKFYCFICSVYWFKFSLRSVVKHHKFTVITQSFFTINKH